MNTAPYQFSSPRFRQLGYLSWLILLIMAIVFYKERAIFLDGAFQLEKLINQGTFKIYHYRLTNPFTQILALSAIYLKLPLKIVLIGYSINFILFFGGIHYAIVRWCKNDFLGWVHLFFFTLMVLDSFYFLPPELYQGSALLLLWWAILLKDPNLENKWTMLGLVLFMIPILSGSRLIATYFLYCFVFFWFSIKELRHWRYYLLFGCLFLFAFIHSKFFISGYDIGKIEEFNKNLETYLPNLLDIPANKIFLAKCIEYYYGYVLAFALVVIGYLYAFIKKRKQVQFPLLKILMVIGGNVAFLLLLHLGSPKTNYRFYAEVNYLPLTILVCIPLLFDILPLVKNQKWVLYGFLLTIIVRLSVIATNHQQFENRHQWYIDKMDEASGKGTNKSITQWQNSPKKMLIQPWASPQETLLLSSLRGPEHSRSLLVANTKEHYTRSLNEGHFFLSSYYHSHTEDDMNKAFFRMGTETEYLILDE
ncbi:MAG: hypothetical protein ACI8YQ_004671 [Polaribacter sp.]|jgi:hypothetical protein